MFKKCWTHHEVGRRLPETALFRDLSAPSLPRGARRDQWCWPPGPWEGS